MTIPEYSVFTKPSVEDKILGALILRFSEIKSVLTKITDDLFFTPENKAILRKIRELDGKGKQIDLVVLSNELPDLTVRMADQSSNPCYPGMFSEYINILTEAKNRRGIYQFAERLLKDSAETEASELQERIRAFAADLKNVEEEQDKTTALYESYEGLFNHDENRFVRSGIPKIDSTIGGYEPGTLNIIGARPATGKSAFVMDISLFAASQGKRVLIINLEMRKSNVLRRMISSVTSLDLERIKGGHLTETEIDIYKDGMAYIQSVSIDVLNKPSKPSEIRAAVDNAMASGGIDVLIVDYLQRLKSDKKCWNRDETVGSICWALKGIAMDYNVPVILLSQLNREASGKRPTCANLRESGNIEQDADSVMLLHRPEGSEDMSAGQAENIAKCKAMGSTYIEAIIDKNREGATAIVPLAFFAKRMKFVGM